MVWQVIIYFLTLYVLAGLGTSMGYHRVLTHQSAQMSKWFEYMLICLGLPAGTPIQWVGNHRVHHGFADKQGDPHSPHISGFWYAHCGWYIQSSNPILCFLYAIGGPVRMIFDAFWRPRTNLEHVGKAVDVASVYFYKQLSKPIIYQSILLIYAIVILLVAHIIFGPKGYFVSWLSLVIIYNLGDAVDSVGHLKGRKTGVSEARNNWFLGLFSFGDGWHSNHHKNPGKAQHGMKPNQIDITFSLMKLLKKVGIIKNLVADEKK